jgi:hypothetical protein
MAYDNGFEVGLISCANQFDHLPMLLDHRGAVRFNKRCGSISLP